MYGKFSTIMAVFILMAIAGTGSAATVSSNWSDFTSDNNASWTFSNQTCTGGGTCTILAGNTTQDGVGDSSSLFANLTVNAAGPGTINTLWRSPNFTWNNGTPLSAVLNFSFRVVTLTGQTGVPSTNYSVFLINPNGIITQINQTNNVTTAGNWNNSTNSIIVTNFTDSGDYSLLLNATLKTQRIGIGNPGNVAVRWDNPSITLQLPGSLDLTNVSALSNTTIAGTNSTYYLNLTNNGTAADTYSITVSNPDGASVNATDITSVSLDVGAFKVFTLNVTNISANAIPFRVDVTATSQNDPTKFGYINTTTTVNPVPPTLDTIVVSPSTATLNVTETQVFTATALNGSTPMEGVNVSWSVINATVGSVSASSGITDVNGNVTVTFTASAAGTTLVNATNESVNGSASVTVNAVPPGTDTVSYNWSDFTSDNNASWTFSNQTCTGGGTCTILAGNTTQDGVGDSSSLFANLTVNAAGPGTINTLWRSPNFTWNNGTPLSAVLNFSFRVVTLTGQTGVPSANYSVFLINPNGIITQINQTNNVTTAGNWNNSTNSIIVTNFTDSGDYSLLLNATLKTQRIGIGNPGNVAVRWDNPSITLQLAAPTPGAPIISSYAPASPVSNLVGETQTFNITTNQTVNVTWYINSTQVQDTNISVTDAIYTNASAAAGFWNITAIATNANGTVSKTWDWNVNVPTLDTIVVSPSTATLNVTETQVFTATALNGSTPMEGVNVSWSVINATVGSVSASSGITDVNGNVTVTFTASATGTTLVNATNESVNGSASVTVNAVPPGTDTVSYNWSDFTSDNNASWTFSNQTCTGGGTCTILAGNTTQDGVGDSSSLFANLTVNAAGPGTMNTLWRSPNFTWNNGTPLSAVLNFSFRVVTLTGQTGVPSANYSVFLINPNGIITQINQTNNVTTAGNWNNSTNSIIVTNFTDSGDYSLLLNATLKTQRIGIGNPGNVAVRWDNPSITLQLAAPTPGAPIISSYAPASPVSNLVGETQTFNITTNQTVNVTWYINGTQVQDTNISVTDASYTNASAVAGFWNVTAIATNAKGTVPKTWDWNVNAVSPILDTIVISPSAATLNITENQVFTATALNGSTPMEGVNVSWSVINAAVGSVSASSGITDVNGNVTVTFTASATGTTLVNATNGSVFNTSVITVQDTTAPVINSVTLSTNTPNTGDAITVTVDATDNVAVTGVTADGIPLVHGIGNNWSGDITALVGTHTVTVIASDAAANTATDATQSYTATTPAYGVSLTVDSSAKSTTVGTNAIYTINLTNTGTIADSFDLVVSNNPDGATVESLTTPVLLDAGASKLISLNITSGTAGTYRVNVTANSTNDPTKIMTIYTTTKVRDSDVSDFTGIVTAANRGGWLNTSVNVTNYGLASQSYIIVVSGVSSGGDPLVATGTLVNLAAGNTLNIPVIVAVPNAAAVGDYTLFAALWKYDEFPAADKLIKTSTSLTVTVS